MKDTWHYDRDKRLDNKGRQWHFVHRSLDGTDIPYDERPDEWYFRDDARTVFGVLRFERKKENPFRNYETMIKKIMNDTTFRETLLAPESRKVWSKGWK